MIIPQERFASYLPTPPRRVLVPHRLIPNGR